jgi:hypothetical protein
MSWSNWHQGIIYEGKKFQEHIKVQFYILQFFYGSKPLLKWMELSAFVVQMIYFGTEYIHNVRHGYNLQDNWLIKKFIVYCLISYHSMCYTLWRWVVFPNLPIALHKVGSNCCENFIYFLDNMWRTNTIFVSRGHWTYFTHKMDWTNKFEEDGSLSVESRWWIFFG